MHLEDIMNLVYSIYGKEDVSYFESLRSGNIELHLTINPNKFIALALGLEIFGLRIIRRYYSHTFTFTETEDCIVMKPSQRDIMESAGFSTSRERFYWGDIKQGE